MILAVPNRSFAQRRLQDTKAMRVIWIAVFALGFGPTQDALAGGSGFSVLPKITWSNPKVFGSATVGQSIFPTVSFESTVDLDSVKIWISPRLRNFLSTPTEDFGSVLGGEEIDVPLRIDVPADYQRKRIIGLILIRGIVSDSNRVVGRLLPVFVRIGDIMEAQFSNEVVSFAIPELGTNSDVRADWVPGPDYEITVAYEDSQGELGAPAFAVYFVPKDSSQSLLDWFSTEVDLSGTLLGTGTFQLDSLEGGEQVLVRSLSIPDSHGEPFGPVSSFYAEYAGGTIVAIANTSQAHNLGDLGYPLGEIQTGILRRLLESVSVSDILPAEIQR